jgi:hypothetical protein
LSVSLVEQYIAGLGADSADVITAKLNDFFYVSRPITYVALFKLAQQTRSRDASIAATRKEPFARVCASMLREIMNDDLEAERSNPA